MSRRGSGPFSPRALMSAGIAGLLTSLMLSTVSSGQGAAVEATTSVSAVAASTTTQAPVATTASAPVPITTLAPAPSPTVRVRPTPTTTARRPRTTSAPTLPPSTTTSTTTTVAPGPHGKKKGRTTIWASDDTKHGIEISVGTYSDGVDYIIVFSNFPDGKTVDQACSKSSAPIYEYASFLSTDGGTTSRSPYSQRKIPLSGDDDWCDIGGIGVLTLYRGSYWQDASGRNLSSPPPPIHVRFTLKNLRSNTVVESPWVPVDASRLP